MIQMASFMYGQRNYAEQAQREAQRGQAAIGQMYHQGAAAGYNRMAQLYGNQAHQRGMEAAWRASRMGAQKTGFTQQRGCGMCHVLGMLV